MAFLVRIPLYLAQCALHDHSSHSSTEFVRTGYTVLLLVILDVPDHN